jgi:hypothetical protein
MELHDTGNYKSPSLHQGSCKTPTAMADDAE